jgi:hypothetical protein
MSIRSLFEFRNVKSVYATRLMKAKTPAASEPLTTAEIDALRKKHDAIVARNPNPAPTDLMKDPITGLWAKRRSKVAT